MIAPTRESVIKPGMFSMSTSTDDRRIEFDCCNECLMLSGIRPDALFIGDSITHLWELQAFFGGTEKIIINRGIGGDVSKFVRKRFEADALQLKPKLIVMMVGTNDLGWALEALDDAKVDTLCENISAMAEAATSAGIPIALASLLPIWGPSWYPVEGFALKKNKQIASANVQISQIAESRNAVYVDYYSEVVDNDGFLRHEIADDGIHPHFLGYKIMAKVLRKALAQAGIEI